VIRPERRQTRLLENFDGMAFNPSQVDFGRLSGTRSHSPASSFGWFDENGQTKKLVG
jgi:hypothetical protein